MLKITPVCFLHDTVLLLFTKTICCGSCSPNFSLLLGTVFDLLKLVLIGREMTVFDALSSDTECDPCEE